VFRLSFTSSVGLVGVAERAEAFIKLLCMPDAVITFISDSVDVVVVDG